VTRLTIYGDFNCPFSALASIRADVLLTAADAYEIDWRAIQHDAAIPPDGEPLDNETALGMAREVAIVAGLGDHDVRFRLAVPRVRSNTAAACAAMAGAGDEADLLRRRIFAAVWAEGRNISDTAEIDRLGGVERDEVTAHQWQIEFQALPRPITPTLVLPDGYISRGLGALARLADLVAASRNMAT
jgi:predicted DsbA family dithiol-disulfide isomerase